MTDRGGQPALELRSVTKTYGSVTALSALDLTVAPGELVSVIGPSGCGKSTTLRLIAGLEKPTAGEVRIAGAVVAGSSWVSPERRRVGLVFQDHALFPHLDVTGNVSFGLHGLAAAERRARVAEVLGLVRLGQLAGRYPHELSGGEQQRVALARALAPRPAVVLLDEPFSSLDESLRAQVRADTLGVLRETGITALFVTHDQTEALSVGDRVVVLREGVTEQVGTPETVFERPATRFVAAFMGDAHFLPVSRTDGRLVCELGSLGLRLDDLPGVPPDGDLDVVLRPHEVTLASRPAGPAEVVDAEYHGAFVIHTVRLASGRTVRSWQPSAVRHPVGTRVEVSLTPGLAVNVVSGDRVLRAAGLRVPR